MDNSAVKQKCRMSLNLPREQSVSETIHVKSKRNSENVDAGFYNPYHGHPFHQKLEMTEITMSSELFLAPEMMYTYWIYQKELQKLPKIYLILCSKNVSQTFS